MYVGLNGLGGSTPVLTPVIVPRHTVYERPLCFKSNSFYPSYVFFWIALYKVTKR